MKRCPTCGKNYTDQNLSFCIEDGTPLLPASQGELPAVTSSSDREPAVPTYGSSDWKAPSYQPPSSYVPPGSGNKRRAWPWVLGIISVLVVGIVIIIGAIITAKILLPRTPIPATNRNRPNNSADGEVNSNERSNLNSDLRNENANETGQNVNTSEADSSTSAAPTDKEQVLAQLKDIENDWTVANLNADRKKLERILADDYVGTSSEGKTQGKAEYIKTIERNSQVQKWSFEDLKLSLRGDRATLTGAVRLLIQDRDVTYHFNDKFVWREGRWQATGSEVELMQ